MRPITRKRILDRFKNRCANCKSVENLQIDHIIPVCRGGREDEDNMQVLCRKCNLKKGRSIDVNKYFKRGDGKTYILMKNDMPLLALNGNEFQSILNQKFKELCQND